MEKVTPQLEGVLGDRLEGAGKEAAGGLPDGPFRGVPMLLKDLGCHVAGDETRHGTSFLAGVRWPTDSYLGRRFREAGFVFLRHTHVPEVGTTVTTQPAANPPARNPSNPAHATGR